MFLKTDLSNLSRLTQTMYRTACRQRFHLCESETYKNKGIKKQTYFLKFD